MNLYVSIATSVVSYIEDRITEHLSLHDLAERFHFSENHFSRLFNIMVGMPLKQYILGRKLSLSAEMLKNADASVAEIAYSLGFAYPEVYSRAFKKFFGITPSDYRRGIPLPREPVEKADVVSRDIANYQGSFALKERFVRLPDLYLSGVFVEVNEDAANFYEIMNTTCGEFLRHSENDTDLQQDVFYSAVTCDGEGKGGYIVFFGKEQIQKSRRFRENVIPTGWYASFKYYGDMADMRLTFNDDYYKWIIAKEIDLRENGVGMLTRYSSRDVRDITIFVPAQNPKIQQETSC